MPQTKEEKNAKNREYMVMYYAKNKEKVLAYAKQYSLDHKDARSAYIKEYVEKNKEKIAARKKEYNEKNKEILKQKRKEYRIQNKEKRDNSSKQSKMKNREKYNAISRAYSQTPKGAAIKAAISEKRRAAQKSAPMGDLQAIYDWLKDWKAKETVFCHWCNKSVAPKKCHVDHVIPLARGGAHCLSNLVIACAKCNLSKSSKMPDEWMQQIRSIDTVAI